MAFLSAKSYCDNCPLEKSVKDKKIKRLSERNEYSFVSDNTDIDILFVTDCVEQDDDLSKLKNLIVKLGVERFAIVPAIGCRTVSYEIPSPFHTTYSYCKSLDIEKYNPKVIVTFGKALLHFTRGSVFESWRDFREYLFNDTFFYPHIKSKWKGRIYPCAFIHNLFDFGSFEHHHFKHQIKEVINHIKNYEKEKFIMSEYDIVKVDDFDKWIEDHKNETRLAIDTETNNLNVFVDNFKVGCVQISFDGKTGYYLPMGVINKRKFSFWLKDKYQIYSNGKYDCKALNRERISGHKVDEDVSLVYHLLNIERESNSIKVLSWFIGFGGYGDDLDEYVHKYKIKNYLDIPESILMKYAAMDAIVTYLLEKNLQERLVHRQPEVYKTYRDIVLPVIPVFQSMEEEGILVDKEYVKKYHDSLVVRMKEYEKEIFKLLGKEINIASGDELGEALEKAGLPDHGRTKKGFYQTGEDILNEWQREGYEVATILLNYRKVATLDKTFVGESVEEVEEGLFSSKVVDKKEKGIYQYIMSDSRVHGNFLPAITDSWRSASNKPNLQNCFSKDTQILTDIGWVDFEKYTTDLKVAQYDIGTGNISFVTPSGYVKRLSNNILHIYSDEHINMMVTEDHECLLQHRKNNKFIKVKAIDYKWDYKQIVAGKYIEGAVSLSESMVVLICAMQADGHIRKDGMGIEFKFSKKRKIDRLQTHLDKMGINYKKYNYANGQIGFYLYKQPNIDWMYRYKFFDYEILNYDKKTLELFCDEIRHWDGLFIRKNTSYCSVNEQNCDVVQTAFMLIGKRSKYLKYKNKYHELFFVDRDYCLTTNTKKDVIEYNDNVYCVQVPFGNIVTRYNKVISITGNCPKQGDEGKDYRKTFIAPEDYFICEADYSGFQLRLMCDYSRDPVMTDAFLNMGGDLHSQTSYAMLLRDKYIYDLEMNDGSIITLSYFNKVKIKREDIILIISPDELQENDEFVEVVDE